MSMQISNYRAAITSVTVNDWAEKIGVLSNGRGRGSFEGFIGDIEDNMERAPFGIAIAVMVQERSPQDWFRDRSFHRKILGLSPYCKCFTTKLRLDYKTFSIVRKG